MAADQVSSFMVCGSRFDVPAKYKLTKPIGQGAYGVVVSAQDKLTGEKVAIKKIARVFDNKTDAKRTLREIRILSQMDHENVIKIIDIFKPPSLDDFEDLYIVTNLMDTDLHQIVGSNQPLTDDHAQYFLYQILRGLKYVHSSGVLHRDLKPSNLLLNSNCDLQICDFGLARIANDDSAGFLTEYVATRWYRAPEIMLSWKAYTTAVDVWAVGCIFAELLSRRPLFPGRDYIHQLTLITDVVGTPTADDLEGIGSDKARNYMRSMPFKPKISWAKMFPNASADALDLLDKLLLFNPRERITVDEALAHPYLDALHDADDEPEAEFTYNFDFEYRALSRDDLKQLIFDEIVKYHPELEEEEAARKAAAGGGDEVAAAEAEPAPMDGVSGVADMDTDAVAAMTP